MSIVGCAPTLTKMGGNLITMSVCKLAGGSLGLGSPILHGLQSNWGCEQKQINESRKCSFGCTGSHFPDARWHSPGQERLLPRSVSRSIIGSMPGCYSGPINCHSPLTQTKVPWSARSDISKAAVDNWAPVMQDVLTFREASPCNP